MTTKQPPMPTYTREELTEMILRSGERLLAIKHRPAPVWPRTAAVRQSEGGQI